MLKLLTSMLAVLCSGPLLAIDAQVYCGNSWKSGTTKVIEQSFTVTLDKKRPEYRTIIKEANGRPRFKLSMWINWSARDKVARDWWAELTELGINSKDLLPPTNDPEQDAFSARDWPGWFIFRSTIDPKDDEAVLPFQRKRAIRIEGFYLVMVVSRFARNKQDPSFLNSATFDVQVLNEYPPCRK